MKVIVDGSEHKVLNSIKAIISDDGKFERHVTISDEGIIIDIISISSGEVLHTLSVTHDDLLSFDPEEYSTDAVIVCTINV